MKLRITIFLTLVLSLTVLFGMGCGGDNGGNDAAGGNGTDGGDGQDSGGAVPKLSGKWTGRYGIVQTTSPQAQPITATIRQNGSAVVVDTSLTGVGSTLTGTIEPNGEMTMIDPFDGETWTTYYGPASETLVTLADFIYDSELGADSPLQVIDLTRAP